MYSNGFLKVTLASPTISIGNPLLNVGPIVNILNNSSSALVLFPELSITGYTAADLFFQDQFLGQTLESLEQIIKTTTYKGVYVLGLPFAINDCLYNVAAVIQNGKILGLIPKYYLPNYKEFNEKRWFQSGLTIHVDKVKILNQEVPFGKILFHNSVNDILFGVEICQDMWTIQTPGDTLALAGAHLILNLSASTEYVTKVEGRRLTVVDSSRKQNSAYLYTSCGTTESSVDVVYSPHKIAAVLGSLIAEDDLLSNNETLVVDIDVAAIKYARRIDSTHRDQQIFLPVNIIKVEFDIETDDNYKFDIPLTKTPFIPQVNYEYNLKLAHQIQISALKNKLNALPNHKVIIGVSGGLDSALALLVACSTFKALKRDLTDIIAVTMPAVATSKRSKSDALKLMAKLGVTALEIPISKTLDAHLLDLEHDLKDVTYENAQARIRTLNLMNLANKHQGFVLGTGDLSEIALGWMTFNGDHMSMYDINAGVTKTFVQELIKYHSQNEYSFIKDILESILKAPISPELLEDQKTEDVVGSYLINDFILYHFLVNGASETKVSWLLTQIFSLSKKDAKETTKRFFDRFYSQQFKRQPMPEGPKVLKISLSPRGEFRLPSDLKRK